MGVAKRTRKFAQVKRLIGQRDARLQKNKVKEELLNKKKKESASGEVVREIPQAPSGMFFAHNENLVPPYQVLMPNRHATSELRPLTNNHRDTNFFAHTTRMKLPVLESAMDCLYASVNPIITSCVMAELEKMGKKYKVALMQARDERFTRITCDHKGTYADDCIVDRIQKHRIYIVATNDKDLKKRIRKVPGVPILSVAKGKYVVERLPNAPST